MGAANGAAPRPEIVEPIVYVNGKRRVLPDGYAETTLLEYLRGEVKLKGGAVFLVASFPVLRFSEVSCRNLFHWGRGP